MTNQTNHFGNLLIQDGGKKHEELLGSWIGSGIVAAVFIGIALYLQTIDARGFILIGNIFSGIRINHADIVFFAQILLSISAVGALGHALSTHLSISGTKILVYEHGVKGTGVSPKLAAEMDGMSSQKSGGGSSSFQLSYEQITSADITEKRVSVNTPGKQYVIYVQNPQDIATLINTQKLAANK